MTYVRGSKRSSPAPQAPRGQRRIKTTDWSLPGGSYSPPSYSSTAQRVQSLVSGLRMLADLLERIRKMDIVQDEKYLPELSLLDESRVAASLALVEEGVSAFQGGASAAHSNSSSFAHARHLSERQAWFGRSK